MGYIRVKGTIANPADRSLSTDVEFIVDTGAIYAVLPRGLAEKLRLREIDRRKFRLADGSIVEYPVSEAYIVVEGRGVTSLVVIGPDDVMPLLGVVTLELLGLEVDPATGRLRPMELMLL